MRTKVYVASPISKGDLATNIRRACEIAVVLLKAGYSPLVPALNCFYGGYPPEVTPCGLSHEDWLQADFPWVAASDAVLRLPGESKGADRETALAVKLGIPVYTDLEDLLKWCPKEMPDKLEGGAL